MPQPVDLEGLRELFKDDRTHSAIGKVTQLGLSADRSQLRAQCKVLSQDREVIATVAWDSIGPDSGSLQFPVVGDLVLLLFCEGDDDHIYLIKRLSNDEDLIPAQATDGHMVHRSLPGKKLYLASDFNILLGLGGDNPEPNEPLVLGNVLTEFLIDTFVQLETLSAKVAELSAEVSTLAQEAASHTHGYIDNIGSPPVPTPSTTDPPGNSSAFDDVATAADDILMDAEEVETELAALRAEPVESGEILSDLAFTEKGGA